MRREKLSRTAASGVVALIFLILGFQIAIVTGNVFRFKAGTEASSVLKDAGHDSGGSSATPSPTAESQISNNEEEANLEVSLASAVRKALSAEAEKELSYSDSRAVVSERLHKKEAELFHFNPNDVTIDELCRLGFSQKQAQTIINYRNKGGSFSKADDFARMYVVDSAMFARLRPYINIPKIDLNTADSLTLLSIKGIGPYYAGKILQYRTRLGGSFDFIEQLMDIDGFTAEKFESIKDAVTIFKKEN